MSGWHFALVVEKITSQAPVQTLLAAICSLSKKIYPIAYYWLAVGKDSNVIL